MPKVSVVIPTYNRANYICEAIDSVLAQTYKDYEIVVIDDGSTDNTAEVLKKYGERLRYIRKENQGPPFAMNMGVRNSYGEYFVVLDSDDQLMPDMLERQLSVLEKDPGLAFVCAGTCFVDQHGQFIKISRDGRYREKSFKSLLWDNFVWHQTTMTRRRMFDEVGGYDETLMTTHDYDLWLRLSQRYRFEYTDAPLTKYRQHPGNISRRLDVFWRDHLAVLKKKEISSPLSFLEKRIFLAAHLYRFGMFYARARNYPGAAWYYAKSVLAHPCIGVYFWSHETERMRFSLPYRFLKPFVIPFYYLILWSVAAVKDKFKPLRAK